MELAARFQGLATKALWVLNDLVLRLSLLDLECKVLWLRDVRIVVLLLRFSFWLFLRIYWRSSNKAPNPKA